MHKIEIPIVDENDQVVSYGEKFQTHKNPVPLHRAISIVILNGEMMLIQKRPANKPTWPLYWSNACCTHPYKNEDYIDAANRRLGEELGFSTPLHEIFKFNYSAKYDTIWGENEHDAVFLGEYSGAVRPNKKEVADYKWVKIKSLKNELKRENIYTPWFKIIFTKMEDMKLF